MRKFYASSKAYTKAPVLAFLITLLCLLASEAGWGQIAQRGTTQTSSSTSGNTITINKPTGVVAGDLMIAIITKNTTGTNSSLTGWTLVAGTQQGSGSRYTTVLYKVADGTEGANFSFTKGTNNVNTVGAIMAFSGVDPTNPLDAIGTLTGSNGNTATASGITTNTNGAEVIFLGGIGAGSWSNWSGTNPTFTEILDYNNGTVGVGAAFGTMVTAGITGNRQVTLSGNYYYAVMLLALKPLSTTTITSITINPSSIVYGTTSTTFTATISPDPGGGTVQFKEGAANLGSPVSVSSGVATLNYNPATLNVGNHSITAVFSGSGTYAGSTSSAKTLTVIPKPITVTGISANNKIYDGNTTVTFTGGSSSDIINGNVVTYTASGTFSDKNVGNGKTVTLSGVTLGGADAGNYSVSSYPATVTANITPKPLTAASTVASRVYDGTVAPGTVTVGAVSGLVGSETLVITASATNYADANVGTKPTTISYTLADGTNGGLASNYSMANKSVTGDITARPITVTAVTNTKGYDGTTGAAGIPTITSGTLVGSDAGSFTEVYDNKNAGTGKTLIPSGTISDGNGGNNYAITFVNNSTGVINKQSITVTAAANTKTYDANTSAAAAPTVSGTIFSGDVASFTETYDNKNAGTGKTLTPSGSINDGNIGNNYTITFVPANTGVIDQRALTITALINTKAYDGNTSAAAVPTISSGDLQGGETANFTETYDNKNAGTGKVLTPAGIVNDGNSGNNYTYTYVSNNTGVIIPLVLTYVADPKSRVYGTANPALTGTVTGFLSGENVGNATTGTLAFATTAVVTSPVGNYPTTGSGLTALNGNYTFVQDAANATAFTITKADLSITPDNQTKCAGSVFTFSGTEFTSTGLVNSDAITGVTLTSTGAPAGAAPGSYPIVASAAVGTGLGNYNITYNTGSILTVNARPTATITSGNTAICNPGTTNITGNVTAVGAWTITLSDGKTATGNGNGTFSVAVSPTTTTNYTITSLADASCTSVAGDLTGSTTVTVYQPVVITTQPVSPADVCASTNSPRSFTVAATGDILSYQWYKDGNPITGATAATYTISNPMGTDAGTYYVVVNGQSPCTSMTSASVGFVVNQPIIISAISPATSTLCEGGTATFSVTASGSISTYFWRQNGSALTNGGNISGANTNTLTINPVTAANAGNYSLIINGTDDVCPQAVTAVDAVLNVSVKSANPVSATASSTQICNGSSTTLTLNGGGGGTGEVIHWYTGPNGTGTSVGTGNNLAVNPTTTTTYYGRYEDGSPCNFNSADASVTITVDPVSVGGTASMTNPQVCYNSAPANDITLSGNVGAIQWQKSTTLSFTSPIDIVGAVTNTLTASQIGVLTATTYFRAVVKSGVCSVAYSNIITITVNPLPTVVSVTPNTSCGTDNVTLSATTSAGATIDWFTSATGGLPVGTGLTFTTSISSTTTFYAEARNTTTGCISVGRTPVVATFKPKPDAQVSVAIQTICSENTIATIYITNPNATPSTTFSWTRDNATNVTGIADGSGTVISGALTNTTNTQQTTIFTVTPTANGCNGTPVTATVFVNPKPTISVTSAPTAVCYNTPIAISYTNQNNVSGTVLSWTRNNPAGVQAGPAISGNGNISQTLVNTTNGNITVTYTLKAMAPGGCETTVTVPVILYSNVINPPLILNNDQTVCIFSSPDTLRANPATGGSGNFSYTWKRSTDGVNFSTTVGTGLKYLPPAISASTLNYSYIIIATDNVCGNSSQSTSNVWVYPFTRSAGFSFGKSGYPNSPVCSGSNFTFEINSLQLGAIKYYWSSDLPNLTPQNGGPVQDGPFGGVIYSHADIDFTTVNNGNNTVTATVTITPQLYTFDWGTFSFVPACKISPEYFPVIINPVPTMQQPDAISICSGNSGNISLKGKITDATTNFSWTAKVKSGTVNGISSNNSIPAAAGSVPNISFGTTYNLTTPVYTSTTGGVVEYTITPSANGCNNGTPVTVDVTVNPTPTVQITNPGAVCFPTTVDLTANAVTNGSTSGITYTYWTDAGGTNPVSNPDAVNTSGTYYIKGTNASGCSDIKPVTVVVNPQLPVSVSITNTSATTVCAGTSISFSATPTNGGSAPVYQWKVNGLDVTGANSSTFSSSTLSTGDKVTVELTSNAAPCAIGTPALSNEIGITVNPILPVSVAISATSPTTVCAGTAISFEATPTNPGTTPAYQWYVNSTAVSGANGTTFSSTTLQNGDKVSVGLNSSANPCATGNPDTSSEITVTVNPILNVTISISADKNNICAGTSVTFTATATNKGTAPVYQWKLNGVDVGTNSDTYTSSTLNNNDKITCVLTSDASPCGQGSPATSNQITINIKPNAIAGTINAPTTNLCVGGTSYTYVVTGNNATGTWSNAEANGVFSVDASGKVTALQAGTAHLRYTVVNDCTPDGAYTEILLKVGATPAKPDAINGSVKVCSGTSSMTYSVTNVPGLTYQWSVPSGWTFSGQGTNEITITSAVTTGGTVSVTATTTSYACGSSPASTLTVNVTTPGTWLGFTSEWNDANNWCGGIPTSATNVLIPVTAHNPIISTAIGQADNISIASAGASLTVSGQTLQISGTISNSGTFNATSGTLEFNGSSAQSISGSMFQNNTIGNLTLSNNSGLTFTGSNNNVNILGAVSFTKPNAFLNTNNNLVLKSSKDSTAFVGAMSAGNAITGNVTVERYSAAINNWQFLAVPTQTTQTINAAWQEGQSPMIVGTLGYGTLITVPGGGPGMDTASINPSMKYWDNSTQAYVTITSTLTTFPHKENGYFIFIRGDRQATPSSGSPHVPTILRTKGALNSGTIPFNVPANSYFSLGNPYASRVDFTQIGGIAGIGSVFYAWDPLVYGERGAGGYQTLSATNLYWPTVPTTNYLAGTPYPYLESGQAIFVNNTGGSSVTLTFSESAKVSGSHLVFRGSGISAGSFLRTYLYNTSGKIADGNVVAFNSKYQNRLDANDAVKISNTGENLGLKRDGIILSIEARSPASERDTIYFNLKNVSKQTYRLGFNPENMEDAGVTAYLVDNYLKTTNEVSLAGASFADFTVNADAGSYAADRFMIVFKKKAPPPPMTFVSVKASQKDKEIAVAWNVANENNMLQYEVEKSLDGNNFVKVATVAANNNGAGNYQWTDKDAIPGYNYYRIKSVDKNQKTVYSTVVNVLITNLKTGITIHPNPITDGIIHLQFINQPQGRYRISLFNSLGQLIVAKQIEYAGGNGSEDLKWDYNLSHGIYQLEITKPDGSMVIIKVLY